MHVKRCRQTGIGVKAVQYLTTGEVKHHYHQLFIFIFREYTLLIHKYFRTSTIYFTALHMYCITECDLFIHYSNFTHITACNSLGFIESAINYARKHRTTD